IRKTEIKNPIAGTVLTSFAKTGEVVQAGQPLYRIANLASVEVRAYVTEPQLARIRIGQSATVTIDAGPNHQSAQGVVSWISTHALRGVSFTIDRAELFGFIGPDGAGKTTLFRILTTVMVPDRGRARVLGKDVVTDLWALRPTIGYMPGRFSLYPDLTVAENLR